MDCVTADIFFTIKSTWQECTFTRKKRFCSFFKAESFIEKFLQTAMMCNFLSEEKLFLFLLSLERRDSHEH